MHITIPRKFSITPLQFVQFYAAYHGMAYYAMLLCISPILTFDKGYIRFSLNLVILLIVTLIYFQNRKTIPINQKDFPFGVNIFFLYYLWSGLSLLWGDSQGLNFATGISLKTGVFALWLNCCFEFIPIVLMCKIASIEKLAIAYLKGLRWGGLILSLALLIVWLLGDKSTRLHFSTESQSIILENWAAIKLATVILCNMHLFFSREITRKKSVLQFALFTLPCLFTLFLTIGKTAIIGFILSACIYMATSKFSLKIKALTMLFFTTTLAIVAPFISDYLRFYIENDNYLTLTDRTLLWSLVWERITESIWVGHGLGTPFPKMSWNTHGFTGEAHNEYLNALFSTGIVGLIIVSLIFMGPLIAAFKIHKKSSLKIHFPFLLALFLLMFTFSLTASSPVGFFIPLEFQMVVLLWASDQWHFATNRLNLPIKSSSSDFEHPVERVRIHAG